MKIRHITFFLFVLMALLLQACAPNVDTQSIVATALFETQQISALQTAAAGGGGQPPADSGGQPVAPSDTPTPSSTPTITLTNTPSVPLVSVSQDTNCRSGPSVSYTLLTTIHAGQQAEVIKNFSNTYVVVKNPNGSGDCWLWLNYANTTNFAAYNLPFATQPPTSTPTFTPTPEIMWEGDWTMWYGPAPLTACSLHLTRSGSTIDGTYDCGLFTGTVHGTLSGDLKKISGTWTTNLPTNGNFDWMIKKNTNQFIGNYDGSPNDWCGAKNGASQPSPCLWP
jgi:uncharacterized protein YraI